MNQVITNIPVGPKWNKMPNHNFGLPDNDQIQIHSFLIIWSHAKRINKQGQR